MTDLLRHARIVTDPKKLAHLNAEVAERKARSECDRLRARRHPAV
jgi:hypothetical protein